MTPRISKFSRGTPGTVMPEVENPFFTLPHKAAAITRAMFL